jgi:large subunit ribosomal protein L5
MAKAPAAPQKPQAGGKAPAGKGQPQPKRAAKGAPAAAPATPQGRPKPTGQVPARLKDRFKTTILPNLVKERGYPNPFAAPRLDKIVISMGVGEARDNAKVTLRGARMYEFFDRLINVALPRVRDFKGVPPRGFDGRGNYALGLREQLIFPEIVYDKIDKVRGMDVNIVTTARTDEDAKALLTHLGMPFRES